MRRFQMTIGSIAVLVSLAAAGFYTSARADEPKKEDMPPAKLSEATKEARLLVAAFTMAKEGQKTKSPEMLLAAARVIGKTNFAKLTEKELAESNKATPIEAKLEAATLVKEALELGGENADAVKKLADAVTADIAAGTRGAKGKARTIKGTLGVYNKDNGVRDREDVFYITFVGGEPAQISVNNSTNLGDIDLRVYDKNGKLVASDSRTDDDAAVQFNPTVEQQYKVVLKLKRGANKVLSYKLTTN